MATVKNQYFILQGTPVTVQEAFTVVPTGTTGTPGALRTLTHPTSGVPAITYFSNPTRTVNFLSQPLAVPTASVRRTLGTTIPLIEQSEIDDVRVTERWEAGSGRTRMPASFFKLLYEYIINPPAAGEFIIWDPLDLVTDGTRYNVVLLDLRVGGRSGALDASELWADQLTNFDVVATGMIDKTVELDFLIRSVVV